MSPATEWIHNVFTASGMSISEFARTCVLTPVKIKCWFSGEKEPYPQSLSKIAAAFGIDVPENVLAAAKKKQSKVGKLARQIQIDAQNQSQAPCTHKQPRRWHYDGKKPKLICRRKSCEWSLNGYCTMPTCMKRKLSEPLTPTNI